MRHLLRGGQVGRGCGATGALISMVLLGAGAQSLFAQRANFRTFTNTGRLPSGIQIENLRWNVDYLQLSAAQGLFATERSVALGSAFGLGAGATMTWRHRTPRSDYRIQYSGEYNGFTRYTRLRGLDQELSVGFRRKVTPKLQAEFFTNAESTRVSELLLTPSGASALTGAATSVADLSSGSSTDLGFNPASSGAAGLQSPLMLSLFGARLYTAFAAASVVYSASPKLFWFGRAEASRLWYRQARSPDNNGSLLLPPLKDIAGSSGFLYSIRRRTRIGLELEYDRTDSKYHLANATDIAVSLTQYLGGRWFVAGRGGPGLVVTKTYADSRGAMRRKGYVAGGTIGFKGLGHTFLLSGSRSATGRFGFGEDHSLSGSFAWTWQERSSPWVVSSSVGYERLGGSVHDLEAWLVSFAVSRQMTQRTVVKTEFATASNAAPTSGAFNGVARKAVRLAVVWSPSARGSRRP